MYTYQQYSHKAGHIGRIATMRRPTSQQTPRSASVDLGAIPMNTGGGNPTTNSPQNWTVQKDEKYLDSQNKKQTIDIEQIFIQNTMNQKENKPFFRNFVTYPNWSDLSIDTLKSTQSIPKIDTYLSYRPTYVINIYRG